MFEYLGCMEENVIFSQLNFKEISLGIWEILISLKHSRDLYFLSGILVEHFNFLFCNLKEKVSLGRKRICGFYPEHPLCAFI